MNGVRILIPLLMAPLALTSADLHLKKRVVAVPEGHVAALRAPGPRWIGGRSHFILQFRYPANEPLILELNRRGAFVVGAVPEFGLAVSAPDDFSLAGLPCTWAGRLETEDKISPRLENSVAVRGGGDVWFLAEFFADVDRQEARKLAEAAGFQVHRNPDLAKNHLLLYGPSARLQSLAQWDEVAYLFPASRELIHGEPVRAYAGALTSGGAASPQFVTASTGWPKNADGKVILSYVFGTLTGNVASSQVTQEILRALNAWTQYAPVQFVPGTDPNASQTVFIKFASGDHGDGLPFDGPAILAHTFYPAPPNGESIAGDMHFNTDENWHAGANTDIFSVAVHETGHALGLAHVDDPAAVMYPYYRLGAKIGADDIAGIQAIYGGTSAASSAPVVPVATLSLSITSPISNTTTANASTALAGSTANASGTVHVTWQTDHGASGAATGTAAWSAASVPLVTGENTITVTATDTSHQAVQTVAITRNAPASSAPNPTPPTISIVSPGTTVVTTSASTIAISGTASGSASITKVTWQSALSSGNATGTTNWSTGAVPLIVGTNIITVRAYDASGNLAYKSLMVTRH
jgi:hypothetical protein